MLELGACVSLLGECDPLAIIACSRHRPRWRVWPRSHADVTVRQFSLGSTTCHNVSIFLRVFQYVICLFLVPFISNCTMVNVELELKGNPLHFPNS